MRAQICGAASRIEREFADGVEPVIQDVVQRALDAARLSISDIDLVVTVASDSIDGMMVPIRAELAGAFGKSYLNVPSAAGHAVSAAVTAIEAGDAGSVLVVGWGAASKLTATDSRSNQYDPFYMRPLGAAPKVLAALQKQILIVSEALAPLEIEAFRTRMASRLWGEPSGGAGPFPYAFCDGGAALVLRGSPEEAGLIVAEHSSASRSHAPLDGSMDPAAWVREAISGFSVRAPTAPARGRVAAGGSNIYAEMRAIEALCGTGRVACDPVAANREGGGAMAWFGPATGLRPLAELCADLLTCGPAEDEESCLFADLAGPLGQHATTILIERRSAA